MSGPADPMAVPGRVAFLAPFVAAGIFGSYEVHLAEAVTRLVPSTTDEVALGTGRRCPEVVPRKRVRALQPARRHRRSRRGSRFTTGRRRGGSA